mmetsp:Transcript_110400/g.225799  ORF Transcript_110400/g.225799 Transcript_110400/m.225799 type:complete len:246 (-) Transcript_110400:438-1175(-)
MAFALHGQVGEGLEHACCAADGLHVGQGYVVAVWLEVHAPCQSLDQKLIRERHLFCLRQTARVRDLQLLLPQFFLVHGNQASAHAKTLSAALPHHADVVRGTLRLYSNTDGLRPGLGELPLCFVVFAGLPLGVALTADGKVRKCVQHVGDGADDGIPAGRHVPLVGFELDVPGKRLLKEPVQDRTPLLQGHALCVRDLELLLGRQGGHAHAHAESLRASLSDTEDGVSNAFLFQSHLESIRAHLR